MYVVIDKVMEGKYIWFVGQNDDDTLSMDCAKTFSSLMAAIAWLNENRGIAVIEADSIIVR